MKTFVKYCKYFKFLKEMGLKGRTDISANIICECVPSEIISKFLSSEKYKSNLVSDKDIQAQFCCWYISFEGSSYNAKEKHKKIYEFFSKYFE